MEFNLDLPLRSHSANEYPKWVATFLKNISKPNLAKSTQSNEFNMFITRDIERAKRYCKGRYKDSNFKKYGLLASSKAGVSINISNTNVINDKNKLGPWFHDDVTSSKSCCSFNEVATEFDCQGLENDMPIVCWGEDLIYRNGDWIKYTADKNLQDPHGIRLNSYRVLLTSGSDGVVVYLPEDTRFDETYEFLTKAGMREL